MNNFHVDIIARYFADITTPSECNMMCVSMRSVVGITVVPCYPAVGKQVVGVTVTVAMSGGGTMICFFHPATGTSERDLVKCAKKLKQDWLVARN